MYSLLIIGAGGHGQVVKEIAKEIGYQDIAFLDDNSKMAIGKISDIGKYADQYQNAFVGIGNNCFRFELLQKLREFGYKIPTLIHPTAYVSRSAIIESGTVIEPKAIVNANSHIGQGCIVSVGAIIDHDVQADCCCHINAGAIVKAGGKVDAFRKLEAGEIVLGYLSAVVN